MIEAGNEEISLLARTSVVRNSNDLIDEGMDFILFDVRSTVFNSGKFQRTFGKPQKAISFHCTIGVSRGGSSSIKEILPP